MNTKLKRLLKSLEVKAEHWRTTQDDPFRISLSVYVVLKEVIDAIKEATK